MDECVFLFMHFDINEEEIEKRQEYKEGLKGILKLENGENVSKFRFLTFKIF